MSDKNAHERAKEEFNKVYIREKMRRLLAPLKPADKLLSLNDVRAILRPGDESYVGVKSVPLEKIVGSEGRFDDFDAKFRPKRRFLRSRWIAISRAGLDNKELPPISLYKLGDTYFVRDGNHRVSVAKAQGRAYIDAEITELSSVIAVNPTVSLESLERMVADYDRDLFIKKTGLDRAIDLNAIRFTKNGRYEEILCHILVHKYYINHGSAEEISLVDAAQSWYAYVYLPIVSLLERSGITGAFPARTKGDLYLWAVRFWDDLKRDGYTSGLRQALAKFKKKKYKSAVEEFINKTKK